MKLNSPNTKPLKSHWSVWRYTVPTVPTTTAGGTCSLSQACFPLHFSLYLCLFLLFVFSRWMHFLWVGVYWVPRQSIEGRYHTIPYIYTKRPCYISHPSTWRKVDKAQKVLLGLSLFLFLHLLLLLLLLLLRLLHHRHLLTLPLHFAQFSHFLWSIFNWQFISLSPLSLPACLPVCCLPRGTSLLFLLLLLMSSDWFLLSLAQTNRRRLLLLLLLNFSLPGLALENSSVILCRAEQSVLILSLVTEITSPCLPKARGRAGTGIEGIGRGGTFRAVIAALPAMKFIFQFHLLHSYYTSVMLSTASPSLSLSVLSFFLPLCFLVYLLMRAPLISRRVCSQFVILKTCY